MKILIACEYSGTVRDAFAKLGHDATSCDILPTDKPGKHHKGNVEDILYKYDWDMIIAHPPCTYLCNSGVRWLYNKDKTKNLERWENMKKAAEFFKLFLDHPCEKIAIENPVMHGHAKKIIGANFAQSIQPYQFGHTETKLTCLWLKGLPGLKETDNVKELMDSMPKKETNKIHYASPGKDRWKLRSTTFQGIADAMAAQWD